MSENEQMNTFTAERGEENKPAIMNLVMILSIYCSSLFLALSLSFSLSENFRHSLKVSEKAILLEN